jgi:hypothetical protein
MHEIISFRFSSLSLMIQGVIRLLSQAYKSGPIFRYFIRTCMLLVLQLLRWS